MTPPIYRARRKDNGEYIIGSLCQKYFKPTENGGWFIQFWNGWDGLDSQHDDFIELEIDPSTLAISFEDMIDTNGKRIFAALDESGVGGSSLKDSIDEWRTVILHNSSVVMISVEDEKNCLHRSRWADWAYKFETEVTGIYEGDHQ